VNDELAEARKLAEKGHRAWLRQEKARRRAEIAAVGGVSSNQLVTMKGRVRMFLPWENALGAVFSSGQAVELPPGYTHNVGNVPGADANPEKYELRWGPDWPEELRQKVVDIIPRNVDLIVMGTWQKKWKQKRGYPSHWLSVRESHVPQSAFTNAWYLK
jgi:hypothetical protein